ncbi:MAG: sigma 54-dependent Fis family transcriptional regulator [Deltaproteobacteria bacterium]|nr:sigma 54-dependent Fis family transcriptional regulator [Deltaproteobacteria bacterium]
MAAATTTDERDTDPIGTASLLLTGADGVRLVARRWRITVEAGPDHGRALVRDSGTVVVGTDAEADLRLTDGSVSRYHAELRLLSEGVLVQDLGSTNGTRVGGQRVERCLLPPGGQVRFGHTRVRVDPDDRPLETHEGRFELGEFRTASPALAGTLAQLHRAALTDATISIQGETGTGKELLARAIHAASPRAQHPFVVVDLGAVQPTLIESQLFGYTKGAFTGATHDRAGAFESAQGGTVFLDELGELPLDLQPKLLRVLESRTVQRLGEVEARPVDVRFVAATHRDLEALVREGRFRSDLFYRVAVVRVRLSSLRERPEDVPLLAARYVTELSGGRRSLGPHALELLVSYDWPGNVRELRNVIQRAIALSSSEVLEPQDLFPAPTAEGADAFHTAKEKVIAEFELRYVRALLARHQGNVSSAAREAGMSRNALYALMKRVGHS